MLLSRPSRGESFGPGGTLIEIVDLNNSGDAHEVLSDEALDRFVESFPVNSLV